MIIDCTMFHWEFDILELRMRELWDTVDYFVVTESVCDHRGNPRDLVLSESDRFDWASEKLIINVTDKLKYAKTTREHEKYQRLKSVKDAITLLDLKNEDFLIISDVDEIPRPAAVQEMASVGGRYSLHMPMYYYYLNLFVHDWTLPKALSLKYLTDPNFIRTGGGDKEFFNVPNSGWHFSYLGDEKQIQHKLKTFAHDEMDTEKFTDLDHIKESILSGKDLFDRFGDARFQPQRINQSWPQHVLDNMQKYSRYILN